MNSIAGTLARKTQSILAGTLALVGLATGVSLHAEALQATDAALVAAVHARAEGGADEAFVVEHSRADVDSWIVQPGDPRVPASALEALRRDEHPTFVDEGGKRLLLVVAEGGGRSPEEVERPGENEANDRVIAARAAAPRLVHTVGAFAAAWAVFTLAATLLGGHALRRAIAGSLAPLATARRETEAVLQLGQGQRLSAAAPTEIASLLAAVNGLLDRLDAAWATQSRFTTDAAHELRTPVAVLLGEIEVALRREHTAAEYRETLESALAEVQRLQRIVAALTSLARLDAGEATTGRTPERLAELVGRALAAERVQATVTVAADPEIVANVPLLELAVGNLIRNAARHAPGAPLEVRVRAEGGRAIVEVHDGGPGVPEALREAVFQRFGRAGGPRSGGGAGLGLGLALAREVARRHGGDCVLLASPLGGAEARLWVAAG